MKGKTWLERAGTGVQAIAQERARQKEQEGYTAEHDQEHGDQALMKAAIAYVVASFADRDNPEPPAWWPWEKEGFKPGSTRQNLVKAGALICAEIDRLDRLVAVETPIKENG